jgi:hypothetical protein
VLSYERHFLTLKAGLSRVLVELSLNARWATKTASFFPYSSFLSGQKFLYILLFPCVVGHSGLPKGTFLFALEAPGSIAHEGP